MLSQLLFAAALAFGLPTFVEAQSLTYYGVNGTNGLPNYTLPSGQPTPRGDLLALADGVDFSISYPRFEQSHGTLEEVRTWLCFYVDANVTVTNTSSQPWGWWKVGKGFSIWLGPNGLGVDPNANPATRKFGGGNTIIVEATGASLAPGASVTKHVVFPMQVYVPHRVGFNREEARAWHGPGTKALRVTLDEEFASYGADGHHSTTFDIRVGKFGGPLATQVQYGYSTGTPGLQTEIVELPWARLTPESNEVSIAGLDPDRVALRTWIEVDQLSSCAFGLENVGATPAVCGGQAHTQSTYELLDPATGYGDGYMVLNDLAAVGSGNQSVASFDGSIDWAGSSGLLQLGRGMVGWHQTQQLYGYVARAQHVLRSELNYDEIVAIPVPPATLASIAWAGEWIHGPAKARLLGEFAR